MQPEAQERLQQPEVLYPVLKLEEADRTIKQAIAELPTLRKRLDKYKDDKSKAREIYGDLQLLHTKLITAFDAATLVLLEMELDELAGEIIKLSQSVKGFNLMTPDYTKLCAVLTNYHAKLPTGGEKRTTNASIIARLMSNVKMGYYPTDVDHIRMIAGGIEPPGTPINALDPCCGCGLALRSLSESLSEIVPVTTYGIEIDDYRAEESVSRLSRVGFGSYFHSRVSKDAFHLLLLNPPYLSVINESGSNTRSEKRFLIDSLGHLVVGGLLIYIIPFHRLTPDIARVLCDNFEDITVWRFIGDEFYRFKQIAILGTRIKRIDGAEMAKELATLVLTPYNIPELTELPNNRYRLLNKPTAVPLFKGSKFNVAELQSQLGQSKSFSKLFERNKLDSIENRKPLLPLSLGQIGLIGGSGLINGLVMCETPHVIKGRIVKSSKATSEENLNSRGDVMSTTITEVRSNKMIFNVLTPQGFFSLTDLTSGTKSTDDKDDIDIGDARYIDEPDDTPPLRVLNAGVNHGHVRFPLGRIVITANAQSVLSDEDVSTALARHQSGDWGETCPEDARTNEQALKLGERLLSEYTSSDDEKFWIITERDRSYTTVLLPSDY